MPKEETQTDEEYTLIEVATQTQPAIHVKATNENIDIYQALVKVLNKLDRIEKNIIGD